MKCPTCGGDYIQPSEKILDEIYGMYAACASCPPDPMYDKSAPFHEKIDNQHGSVRGVENPQGFGIDERRFVASNQAHLIGSWDLAFFLYLSFSYVFASGTIRRVGLYGFGDIIFQKP